MKIIKTLLAFILLIGLSSCATIILGPTQSIGISSSPSKAKIFINNEEIGNTPKTVTLNKKDFKEIWVRIELDGYYPFETVLTRRTSGWVAGNIFYVIEAINVQTIDNSSFFGVFRRHDQ